MSQNLSRNQVFLEAVDVVEAIEVFRAAVVDPRIRYTVWGYVTEGLAPSPNMCDDCDDQNCDEFELEDPDDLLDMFPYGEWLDDDTFAVNLHPNCHCTIIREEDVYW
ncbi:MAG: hypothetical protein ABSC20_09615 [Candidatus Bathyarchaeia archaeon]